MKLKATLPAIALALVSTMAMAADSMTVVGRKSCGAWLNYKASGDKFGQTVVENWVMGYLSGVVMTTGNDFLKKTDGESAFLWIDQYCQKNPLSTLVDANDSLIKELKRK